MVEEIPIAPLNSSTLRSEFTLHRGGVLNPFLSKPSHLQGSRMGSRGSSATRSSSKSRFPGNWKNHWKFALSSAPKRGRHDPYARRLAEPPGPRAKLTEAGLHLCFLASHHLPGAGSVGCCFKFCSAC